MPVASYYLKNLNLPQALANRNYDVLIKNLTIVLETIGFGKHGVVDTASDHEFYEGLNSLNKGRMKFVISREIYTHELDNKIDKKLINNLIFHYCQNNSGEAGKLLNRNIWMFWHSDVSDALIDAGADVHALDENTSFSTIFQAVRAGVPGSTLQKLLDAGAGIVGPEVNGFQYSILMIALLDHRVDLVSVLANRFPDEISATLEQMDNMLAEYQDGKFSCQFGDYTREPKKEFYNRSDIERGKQVLESIQQKRKEETNRVIWQFFRENQRIREFIHDPRMQINTPRAV